MRQDIAGKAAIAAAVPAGASVRQLRAAITACLAELEAQREAKVGDVTEVLDRLRRTGVEIRRLTAEREQVRDDIDHTTQTVAHVLGLLDRARTPVKGLAGSGGAPAGEPDESLVTSSSLRNAVARANRRVSALSEQLRAAKLSHDVTQSQMSHLREQLARLREEKSSIERALAALAESGSGLHARLRLGAGQSDRLASSRGAAARRAVSQPRVVLCAHPQTSDTRRS